MSAELQINELLMRWSGGDRGALDQIIEILYRDIHGIGARALRGERFLTLGPTALVNETYLRIAQLRNMQWQDRGHFLAMVARVMRQAVVDEARRRRAEKRDGGVMVTFRETALQDGTNSYDAVDVDDLLNELEDFDAEAAEVVSLRIFGGFSVEEAAETLRLSVATVNRRWAAGKYWLIAELGADQQRA